MNEDYRNYYYWMLWCERGYIDQKDVEGILPEKAVESAQADKGEAKGMVLYNAITNEDEVSIGIPAGAVPKYFRRIHRVNNKMVSMTFFIGWEIDSLPAPERKYLSVDAVTGEVTHNATP